MTTGAQYSPPNPARHKIPKPPVLYQGVGHQTPAHRTIIGHAFGTTTRTTRSTGKRKKKGSSVSAAPKKRRSRAASGTQKRRTSSSKAHLVKGSAAAKKRMSALRAMRGKKAGG